MKKIISATLLILLTVTQTVGISYSAESCKYTSEWEQCIEENNWGNPWAIDPESEFLCVSSQNEEKVIYNIILDKQFKVIDEKANEYLDVLEKNKDYYFGPNRKAPFLVAIDDIEKYFGIDGVFYNQYYKACDWSNPEGIMQETVSCLGWATSISVSKWFFSNSLCITLAEQKLKLQKKTAYNILELNKQAVRTDSKKLYVQEQRGFYNVVVDLFMFNLGYLLRLSQKWASKTKNPY